MEYYSIVYTAFILILYIVACRTNRFEVYAIDVLACIGWLVETWSDDTMMLGVCILTLMFSCLGRTLWTFFGSKERENR